MIEFETKPPLSFVCIRLDCTPMVKFQAQAILNYDLQSPLGVVKSLDRNLFRMQLRTNIIHCSLLFMQLLWGKPTLVEIHIVIYTVLQ